jgi:starch synthase (maltosyl-transferring)
MEKDGRKRVAIENVKPSVNCGKFQNKRVIGEKVIVSADIVSDGHDKISAELLFRYESEKEWSLEPMLHIDNVRWQGSFPA